MLLRRLGLLLLAASLAIPASLAHAGQIRVSATGGQSFSPANISCNVGDQIVWVTTGSSHTVTSGDANTVTPNGHFSGGSLANLITTGKAFSWQSTTVRHEPYYCIPHAPSMAGDVNVLASGASVSDFRIVQVQFNVAGGADLMEIANFGAAGDLALYRIKVSGVATAATTNLAGNTVSVPSAGHVVIHFGVTGASTATDFYFPAVTLPDAAGSVALYVPNSFNTAFTDATQIIDYVAWGSGGQENEATAVTAGLWANGAAITNVAAGHSIQFCGNPGQYGLANWSEIGSPTFPSSGSCTTPTLRSTWGRVKALYR